MNKQASQRPWVYEKETIYTKIPDGLTIAEFVRNEANAKLIVKAVNSHEDLVIACQDAACLLSQEIEAVIDDDLRSEYQRVIDVLQVALSKAEKGE